MEIMILLSIGLYFFLPYYLNIFLLNKKKTINHIKLWLIISSIMVLVEFCYYRHFKLVSLLVLIALLLYYFFTYMFHVKDIYRKIDRERIQWIVELKYFKKVFWIIVVLFGIFAIVDIVMLYFCELPILISSYIAILIIIGYAQVIIYGKEYCKLADI